MDMHAVLTYQTEILFLASLYSMIGAHI
jgi:hypothetical protein